MARITGTMGRPIQGISQQPNNTRLSGQCTASVNLRPDVVRGLTTRMGAEWIGELGFTPSLNDKWFHYRRDELEQYFINISTDQNQGIRIFDKNGNACSITNSNTDTYISAMSYLYQGSNNFQDKISNVTIGDTTMLANSDVVVAESGTFSPSNKHVGVVYCQFMDYGQTHSITVNGIEVASYTSPDGSTPSDKDKVDTTYVAKKLHDAIIAAGGGGSGSTVTTTVLQGGSPNRLYVPQSALTTLGVPSPSSVIDFYNVTKGHTVQASYGNTPVSNSWWLSTLTSDVGDQIRVSYIATPTSGGGAASSISAVLKGNTLFITKNDGSDFTLDTLDGADGGNLIAVKDTVLDVSRLPARAPQDMVVKIAPKNGDLSEEYYLRSEWNDSDGTDIQWVECPKPALDLGFKEVTMPVSLVREVYSSTGSQFSLSLTDWGVREVGNDKTNPMPAFVGSKVSSISSFQNRLLISSGETITLSRSSEFFNFFKTTTQSILDTDPYEVYSDSNDVVNLRSPIAFNGDVMFFTDTVQMALSGTEVVSPNKPTPLRQVSSFEVQPYVNPVAAGENIFFAFDYGRFTGIREFFTDSITDTKRARPITDHVNQLLEGRVRHMTTSTSINMLAVQTEDQLGKLYVYDWMWQGSEKVQSAWGVWEFEEDTVIHFFKMAGSDLFLVYTRNGQVSFVKYDLGAHPDDIGGNAVGINFALDHKRMVDFTLTNGQFIAPESSLPNLVGYTDESIILGIQGEGGYVEDIGTDCEISYENGNFILSLLPDDVPEGATVVKVLTGIRIKTLYTPSNPYPKDQDGTARSDFDRLQVGRMTLNYDLAGACQATLTNSTGLSRTMDLVPRVIGNGANTVGFSKPVSGTYRIPVRSRATQYELTVTSDSHLPLHIRELEFDGLYNPRGRTI